MTPLPQLQTDKTRAEHDITNLSDQLNKVEARYEEAIGKSNDKVSSLADYELVCFQKCKELKASELLYYLKTWLSE